MKRAGLLIALGAAAAALVVAWLARGGEDPSLSATISAAEALGGADTTGFARARGPREFAFPADHGPHDAFRNEWWYVTGHLDGDGGRRFGYQLTIFRNAVAPPETDTTEAGGEGTSSWRTNQVYMGHFALTDIAAGAFNAFERFARGALGLAGARAEPFRVWIEDWVMEGPETGLFPLKLTASQEGVGIALTLRGDEPVVLQGDRGWSRKGRDRGNASYYYSFTRMTASGTVRTLDGSFDVHGTGWLDREWSTSALDEDVEGWDWFSLQLADGRDIMLYRLRLRDGGASPFSAGTLVGADGVARKLSWDRVSLEPLLDGQEWTASVRYWEGAVAVRGTSGGGATVTGRGYVELTGYDGTSPASPGSG